MQRTCTGSKERVGENSVMNETVAECDAGNTVNDHRMLRVEHKIINVLHIDSLGS